MKNRIMTCAAIVVLSSGCAVNRTLQFNNLTVSPGYRSSQNITVAFQDKREDVLSGKRKQTYCGQFLSTAQIGYNVNTESGKTLAQDFAQSIKNSLEPAGMKASVMDIAINDDSSVWMKNFTSSNTNRLLMVTIKRWEAISTPLFVDIKYEVFYDLSVKVYNKEGALLATAGRRDVHMQKEGQLSATVKKLQSIANEIFIREMNALLNEPAIKAALQ
jgi:hypothetical protein